MHKILMVNTCFGIVGGVERYLLQISQVLKKQGWLIYGLFETAAEHQEAFEGIFERVDYYQPDQLNALIKRYQSDGIGYVFFHKVTAAALVQGLRRPFPTLSLIHDHDYYCLRRHKYFPVKTVNCHLPLGVPWCAACSLMLERKKGKFQLIPVFQRLALLHQIRQTDITLVLSDYMKSNLVRNGWSKDSIHKLYPISNVIEPPPFTHTKADTPVILYVGQLIKGKGIDLLLQALSRISIPYQCCIVGSGNAEANLKELAAKLNLSNKLSWIGWTDDIDAYYAKAQLVVVPSRWQEPFGLIGIEAFAHSIPVVGFDVGGISEWLKHKVNGLLVRENDVAGMAKAITTLITNPEKAHQYGLAGNLMVQREYSEAGFIERFSALCQSLSVTDIAGGIENPDPKISIFGISFINATMSHALGLVESRIEKKIKTKFYFVNADCYNKIFIDKEYQTILAENDVIFPDGSGIKMAGKLLGKKVLDNVNGTDMLPLLCTLAAKKGYRIFLLGAAPGVAEQMKINLQQQYPGLCICGLHHGFFAWDTAGAEVTKQINAAKPDIVLVAFGAPLQEKWISRYFTETDAWILMGVGGLFDFYSGRIPRAPLWMRRLGIEWVFRLIQEPKRMWKRYILGNPLFLYRVWRWKNSNKGR